MRWHLRSFCCNVEEQQDVRAVQEEEAKLPEVVYCVCRQADDPNRAFIECEDCQEWFHPECVGTTLQVGQLALCDNIHSYRQENMPLMHVVDVRVALSQSNCVKARPSYLSPWTALCACFPCLFRHSA